MKAFLVAFAVVMFCVPFVSAQEDAEGCSDLPILTRLSACHLDQCDASEYDEAEFIVGPVNEETGEPEKNVLEGKKSFVNYMCPNRISTLQMIRNAETALKKAGFTSVYSGRTDRVATLRKGGVWVQVEATEYAGDENGYSLTVIESGEMEQEMVADASAWADEIARSGRVAVYGIQFDTGKATIKSEGEPVLREIVSLLDSDGDLRLRVEGHTDNVGAAAANKSLSEQRAKAVVAWLVSNGVDQSRLTAAGLGASAPVADNATEEGRAKNRRVELVKQ